MAGIIKNIGLNKVWFQKTWDLAMEYGYHIQVYNKKHYVGYGFSKNKFTAYRKALKDLK